MRHKESKFFEVFVSIAIVVLLIIAGYTLGAKEKSRTSKVIEITQTAKTKVVPDQGKIVVSVITRGNSSEKVSEENKEKSNRLIDALSQYKTESINFYLTEDKYWNFTTKEYELKGYIATHRIRITCKPDEIGKVIDLAIKNGASEIESISYELSEEYTERIKEELLDESIKKALQKAHKIAELSGLKLGKIVKIRPSAFNYYPVFREYASLKGDSEINFQPEEQTVTYSVYFEIELKN